MAGDGGSGRASTSGRGTYADHVAHGRIHGKRGKNLAAEDLRARMVLVAVHHHADERQRAKAGHVLLVALYAMSAAAAAHTHRARQ